MNTHGTIFPSCQKYIIFLAILSLVTQGCASHTADVGNNVDDLLISNEESVHGVIKVKNKHQFEYQSMSIERACLAPCTELPDAQLLSLGATTSGDTPWKLELDASSDLLVARDAGPRETKQDLRLDALKRTFSQNFFIASAAAKSLFPSAPPLDLQLTLIGPNTGVPLQLVTRKSTTHIPLAFYVKVPATNDFGDEEAVERIVTHAFDIAMHEYGHALRKEAGVEVDTMTEEIWARVFELTINLARVHRAYPTITGQLGLPDGIFAWDGLRSAEELVKAAEQDSSEMGLTNKNDRDYIQGLFLFAAQLAKLAELPAGTRTIDLNDQRFMNRLQAFTKARFYSNTRFEPTSF